MRKVLLISSLFLVLSSLSAQDALPIIEPIYIPTDPTTDSIYISNLTQTDSIFLQTPTIQKESLSFLDSLSLLNNDSLLFLLLEQQWEKDQALRDSFNLWRMENEKTTAFPFKLGYRDSMRIKEIVEKTTCHPLALPLYYIKPTFPPLLDTVPKPVTIYSIRNKARDYITSHCPEVYVGIYDSIHADDPTELYNKQDMHIEIQRGLVQDVEEERREYLRALRERRTSWRREATVMLQITQNYATKNWYAGSNSNFAVLGIVRGLYNYDNLENITWENNMEWRIGVNTVEGDSLRKANINEDNFRYYTKLGIKAWGHFSYSGSVDIQTHFFSTYVENTNKIKTGLLTPIRLNLALGLDYKPVKGLSVVISPLNYKMVYANDTMRVAQTSFGIEEGKKVLNDIGSSLRVNWVWKPVREIALDSKFYIYTNYKKVEIDLEVVCDFIINRYFSARLMVHPRYDNTVILPDDEKAKIQFKELLSVGFAHKFR